MTATQHSFQDGKYSVRQVEVARQPVTARQLAAGAASANTALTATVRIISIRAVGADIRYSIGTSAQTATTTTMIAVILIIIILDVLLLPLLLFNIKTHFPILPIPYYL